MDAPWSRFVVAVLIASSSFVQAAGPIARRSPVFKNSFQQPLHIPEVKKPLATYTNPETGVPIDFYEVEVKEFEKQFYPNLGNAKVIGYDGDFPGPTFNVEMGRETVVRAVNKATRNLNFHLHGSYTRSPWDGWAEDVLAPGHYKDYYFPNSINGRSLWYHDHANHENAINMYKGLLGMYQIIDSKLDTKIGLPSGGFDIPLLLTSHYFTSTGDLTDESKERASIYGDTWLVNGQIQPHLKVTPRKYRFRVLNGAVSRTLNFTIEVDNKAIPLTVVAGDSGLREGPVNTNSLVTGMAERWEVVVDFTPHAGKNLLMRSTNMWTDPNFADSDEIMQFQVSKGGAAVRASSQDTPLPARFPGVNLKFPTDKIAATRNFTMVSHMDMMWGINNYHMDDSMKRMLMRPPLGTVEKYIFRSSGMSMGNGMMGGSGTNDNMNSQSGTGGTGGHDMSSMMGVPNTVGSEGASNSAQPSHHSNGGMMSGHDMSGMTGSTEDQKSTSDNEQMSHHGAGSTQNSQSMEESIAESTKGIPESPANSGHSSHHGSSEMVMKRSMAGRFMYTASDEKLDKRQMGGMMHGSMGGNNYWTHAMHLHLVDMRLISRRKEDPSKPVGRDYLESYEQGTVKDIVLIGSNEVVEVLVKFQPYPGVYMWHCHNAVHEDKGMMAVMNVTRLKDFGYSELDSKLEDPLDRRFQARPYTGTNLDEIRSKVLPGFAALKAYPNPVKLIALEEKYWSQRSPSLIPETGENVVPNTDPTKLAIHESHHGKSSIGNMHGLNSPTITHGGATSGSDSGSSGMANNEQSGQHGAATMSESNGDQMTGMSSSGHSSHHG